MERLIKHYTCFFDEHDHQDKFFPNSSNNFHHLEVLIHKIIQKLLVHITTNRIHISVGFFLQHHSKIII
jgi:hypothetical protein